MKKIVLIVVLKVFGHNLFSQLEADAGLNLYLCDSIGSSKLAPLSSSRQSKLLGSTPTARGGAMPYKYKWTYIYKTNLTSKPYIYASDLLNDTSISNPVLKDGFSSWLYSYPNRKLTITLEVTDNTGTVVKDSIDIIQSLYKYKMVSERYKSQKDTILFESNIGGGVIPLKFSWSPRNYILDSNINPMRTYSPIDVIYLSKATDSLGCIASDKISLLIYKSSIKESNFLNLISNYHNPINKSSIFELSNFNKLSKIEIYNSLGHIIHSQKTTYILEIGNLIKDEGFYFIVFYDRENNMQSIKVQKQ